MTTVATPSPGPAAIAATPVPSDSRAGPRFDRWIVGLALLAVLVVAWQGRWPMSDAKVFLRAGARFAAGEPLYETKIFYRFKYPPTAAAWFAPLSVLPLWLAKPWFAVLIVASLIAIFRRLDRWTRGRHAERQRFWMLITFGGMIHYELTLGQATLPMLLTALWIIDLLCEDCEELAGVILAASLSFKPFAWPLLLWGVLRGRIRFVAATIAAGLAMLAVPLVTYDVPGTMAAWRGFFSELQALGQTQASLLTPENHTLASAVCRWFIALSGARCAPPTWLAPLVAGILLLIPFTLRRRTVSHEAEAVPTMGAVDDTLVQSRHAADVLRHETAMLLAAVPLIGPAEYKYFLLMLPLAWLVLADWPRLPGERRILAILGLVGLGGNIHPLLGEQWSRMLAEGSLVTAGGIGCYLAGWRLPHLAGEQPEEAPVPDPPAGSPPARLEMIGALLFVAWFCFTAAADRAALFDRLQCRRCGEDMATPRPRAGRDPGQSPICKNCGHPDVVAWPQRQQELAWVAAARHFVAARRTADPLLATPPRPDDAVAIAVHRRLAEELQQQWPDLPEADREHLLAFPGRP